MCQPAVVRTQLQDLSLRYMWCGGRSQLPCKARLSEALRKLTAPQSLTMPASKTEPIHAAAPAQLDQPYTTRVRLPVRWQSNFWWPGTAVSATGCQHGGAQPDNSGTWPAVCPEHADYCTFPAAAASIVCQLAALQELHSQDVFELRTTAKALQMSAAWADEQQAVWLPVTGCVISGMLPANCLGQQSKCA